MKPNLVETVEQPYEEPQTRIGERLVEGGLITNDQLRIALLEQTKCDKEMIGSTLVRLGFIGQHNLALALAERAGVQSIHLNKADIDPALLAAVPMHIAAKYYVLPIKQTATDLNLAMVDPFDIVAIDAVRPYFPRHIKITPYVVSKSELQSIIETMEDSLGSVDDILKDLENYHEPKETEEHTAQKHPIIRLVNFIISDAARLNASDIHFEPEDSFIRIRYRIDGVLHQKHAFHLTHWPALSHRIKIMAAMNIADTRSIQDGRFSQKIFGGNIDFRVAIMPSVWGETIAVRLLDHRKSLIPLEQLGYNDKATARLNLITKKPQGITLVTGPTGSGKTTTLYSLLGKLSSPDVHIATLEEPVEFQIDLIRQTAVQEQQGLGFAAGVRGLLRMDPDIILIGEIRDAETAQMALRAAMTGHQVYSTLHANDALSALPRLIDLGLSPRVLAGNLSGIIGQRLVRKLCSHCRYTYTPNDTEAAMTGSTSIKLAEAQGCAHCENTGRLGRTVIAEVITPTAKMDELIATNAMPSALSQCAHKNGLQTMQQDGLSKVKSHEIALSDLMRCVDMTQYMDEPL